MNKYTFTCKSIKTGEWNLIITIVAESEEEALNILSNEYHKVTNYYSSKILVEKVENIEDAKKEAEKCYNEIYKENRITLATLIGGVGSFIAGSQITTKDKMLKDSKNMRNIIVEDLCRSASHIVNRSIK